MRNSLNTLHFKRKTSTEQCQKWLSSDLKIIFSSQVNIYFFFFLLALFSLPKDVKHQQKLTESFIHPLPGLSSQAFELHDT